MSQELPRRGKGLGLPAFGVNQQFHDSRTALSLSMTNTTASSAALSAGVGVWPGGTQRGVLPICVVVNMSVLLGRLPSSLESVARDAPARIPRAGDWLFPSAS